MNMQIYPKPELLFAKEVNQPKGPGNMKKDFGKALAVAVKSVQKTNRSTAKEMEAATNRPLVDQKLTTGKTRQDFKPLAESEVTTDQALESQTMLVIQNPSESPTVLVSQNPSESPTVLVSQNPSESPTVLVSQNPSESQMVLDDQKVKPLDSQLGVNTVQDLTNWPQITDRETSPVPVQETDEPWLTVFLNLLFVIAQLVEEPDLAGQESGTVPTEILSGASQVSEANELLQEVAALLQSISQPELLLQLINTLGLTELDVPSEGLSATASPLTSQPLVRTPEQMLEPMKILSEKPSGANIQPETVQTQDLPKQIMQLKALLEQLLQGKVTIEVAAEAISGAPTLLDQIGLLAKLVNALPQQGLAQPNLQGKNPLAELELELEPTSQVNESRQNTTNLKPKEIKTDTQLIVQTPEGLKQAENQAQNLKSQLQQIKVKIRQLAKSEEGQLPKEGVEESQSLTLKGGAVMNTVLLIEKALQSGNLLPTISTELSIADLQASVSKVKASTSARELVTHVVYKQIIEQSQLMVGKDHSEVKIQLRPESLGRLSLEIAVEHGVVKAEILAESQQVKQLLEANLANLKQTLTNQGLKVDQLVVNLGQSQTQFGQAKEQNGQFSRNQRKARVSDDNFEIAEINTEYGGHLLEENQLVDYKI